jgi:hypothetical protein
MNSVCPAFLVGFVEPNGMTCYFEWPRLVCERTILAIDRAR